MKWHYLVEYLRLLLFATRTVADIIITDILFPQNLMKKLRRLQRLLIWKTTTTAIYQVFIEAQIIYFANVFYQLYKLEI